MHHANDAVPTAAGHRLVGGREHRGQAELLAVAAQFVNARFGAPDGVQRTPRFGLEIHEGKACARQIQGERADANLNPFFALCTGGFHDAVAQ